MHQCKVVVQVIRFVIKELRHIYVITFVRSQLINFANMIINIHTRYFKSKKCKKIICSNMYKLEKSIFILFYIIYSFKKLKKHQSLVRSHLCSEDPF